jgi:hypothetical protein
MYYNTPHNKWQVKVGECMKWGGVGWGVVGSVYNFIQERGGTRSEYHDT